MLRNTTLPFTQVIKLHSRKNPLVETSDKIHQFNFNPISNIKLRPFILIPKYSFFKNDITIDYKKNYYEILQVHEKAELAEIKKSFYKLAKQSHPDTSKGNQELFKAINEAYNILSHSQRRKLYDANRIRKEQNPNDSKAQAQRSHHYQSQDSPDSQQSYQGSEQYEERKTEAYYHYNRGQWQQFRSGYKYHVTPESEYYNNLTNNFSTDKIYQNMKRNHAKQSEKDQAFLSQMEQYFAYVEKVRRKKQQDIEDYHARLEEIERKMYEDKKERFRRTLLGRGFTKVQNAFSKVSDALGKVFGRSSNTNHDTK